jgi:hypothetical protein
MRKNKLRSEPSLLHLVEEATELLRRVDVRAWVWWLAGTAPFVCVLLHFWTDMSRSPHDLAMSHMPEASLMLALAYWWMKLSHCVFGDHLLRHLRGEPSPPPLSFRARARLAGSQALIHCTTPWLLVLSLAAMLPFGWVYAFYHNVTILALSHFRRGGRTRELVRLALRQSNYRPAQNHGFMIILLILAMTVWMNWWLGLLQVCSLGKSFTGMDNFITRNPLTQLSTTVFAATIAAAYLVVGPVVKAVYAIRCFYGMSRKNGEDIAVAFRTSGAGVAAMLMLLCLATPGPVVAQEPAPMAKVQRAPRLDSQALDTHIREVLQQDAFRWRMPRDMTRAANTERGWLAGFVDTLGQWLESVKKDIADLFQNRLKEFFKKLMGDGERHSDKGSKNATPWADMAQLVLRGLLVVLALVLAILLIRQWRRMPPPPATASTGPEINLESDQVIATQLPENEWLRLAQEKIDSGDFRLAMRALFLATLAHLGERRLLAIARSKSNGDYVRELALRARDRLGLRQCFHESVRAFDRSWYGWHDVNRDQLNQFRANHQQIITDAAPR